MRLPSYRMEVFATALAAGNSPVTAARVAGYRNAIFAADALAAMPQVQRRIGELAPRILRYAHNPTGVPEVVHAGS